MWKPNICHGVNSSRMVSSLHSLSDFSGLGSTGDGFVGILMYQSISALLHLGEYVTSGCLQVEHFQSSFAFSGELHISFSGILFPIILFKSLAEHIRNQYRLQILVLPCLMENAWIPTVLNLLEDILPWCPIVKYLIKEVLIHQMLKGLSSLHLNLSLHKDVCCTHMVSHPWPVRPLAMVIQSLQQRRIRSARKNG